MKSNVWTWAVAKTILMRVHRFPFVCWMWKPIGNDTRDKAAWNAV